MVDKFTNRELFRRMLLSPNQRVKETTQRLLQLAAALDDDYGALFEKHANILKARVYPDIDKQSRGKLDEVIAALREELRETGLLASEGFQKLLQYYNLDPLSPDEVFLIRSETIR